MNSISSAPLKSGSFTVSSNDETVVKRSRLEDNTDALTPEVTIKEEPSVSRDHEPIKQGVEEPINPKEFRLPIDPPLGFPQSLMSKNHKSLFQGAFPEKSGVRLDNTFLKIIDWPTPLIFGKTLFHQF